MAFRTGPRDEEDRKFDNYAHAVTVIEETHRINHDGMMFHASGKVTGMIDENVDDFLMVTPAFIYPHVQRFRMDLGKGDVDILAYEGATASADGAAITAFNTNRNSSKTPGLVLTSGPTVTDIGTLINTAWAAPTGTGIGQSANGISTLTAGEEWILKPSTKYLIRITNNSGATIAYRYEFLWYELSYGT